jgi:hypothetical protein
MNDWEGRLIHELDSILVVASAIADPLPIQLRNGWEGLQRNCNKIGASQRHLALIAGPKDNLLCA